MKYRKKPVVIEAIQWTGDNWAEVKEFIEAGSNPRTSGPIRNSVNLFIDTLEGTMMAIPNDWIIRGIKGELYPCKPDIFEATYDEVEIMEESG